MTPTTFMKADKYNLIQFIDKRSGKSFNYIPDFDPYSYGDCLDIKAVFKVTRKYKERRLTFRLFNKEYLIKIFSKL